MCGGQFVGAETTRTLTTQDQIDIALVTGDGSLHVVELKRANIPKMVRPYRNHFIVGNEVHEAVSQTENYLRSLDEEAHTIKSKLGFESHRVFETVVIGHINHNTENMAEADFYRTLRTYNSHLSRVQVITYDQLIANAMNSLQLTSQTESGEANAVEPEPTSPFANVPDSNLDDYDEDFEPPDSWYEEREPDYEVDEDGFGPPESDRDPMPRSVSRSCCAGVHGVQVDGCRRGVAGAGWFCGFFDRVAVVAGSFDRSWAGAVAAGGDEEGGDAGQVGWEGVGPVLRGECPPSRWRCGGSGAGSWRRIFGLDRGRPRRGLS